MRKWYVVYRTEKRIGYCMISLPRHNGLDRESGILAALDEIREEMEFDRETVIIITFFQEILA